MKLHKAIFRLPVYFFSLITGVFLLTSCIVGGDDGSTNNDDFTLSTDTINFTAEAPSVTPQSQSLTGTVNGGLRGKLYILVDVNNAVVSASDVVFDYIAKSGTVNIYPSSAQLLGIGTHTSSITVRACLNDATCATGELSGSPKIVDVSYQVKSSVHAESVMPHIAKANLSGDVVIRGFNFITDSINKVSFTAADATSFSVISDTEIHATYPALDAGTHSVQLSNDSGVTTFSADLVVIETPEFSAGTLQYPAAPRQILKTIYDAERQALFVAASDFDGANFNTTSRQTNRILRYQFSDGALASVDTSVIPLLQGIALSPDAGQLIAITDTQVLHLNPDTLALINSTTVDSTWSASQYFKDIIVTNDGNALLTTGYVGSGSTPTYLYPITEPALYKTNHACTYYSSPGVSANGAYAMFIQGGLSPIPALCDYLSSEGTFAELPLNINQKQCMNSSMGRCIHPVVDKTGSRVAVTDNASSVSIYDNLFFLGKLPISSEAVVFSADGSRIFAYDSDDVLRTYDVNGNFQEIGSGTMLAGSPGTGILKMILSPDGSTLFIAGSNQIIIQPVPE